MDIREINKYSLQEIYDYVVDHLRKQGRKAINGDSCYYRTDGGLSCAVGCLIPDEIYTTNYEGRDIYSLVEAFKVFDKVSGNVLKMLARFQNIHDGCPNVKWELNFKKLAEEYNLQYNVPK